ncbi:MAG TPA: type II secretion system secretin GspD [Rhodanobacteraceae bacterium]|nr:type II secretion system secretin GspD [Rhodanobacteraceae bacterium]
MNRMLPFVILSVLSAAMATLPATARTPAPPDAHATTADGRHTLNLKDADIEALIATVSEITGKNFIVAPNVKGKVTVISAQPMRPDEIYDVFLSVLRVHGYAAVPSGSMIKIMPEAMAQQDGGATPGGAAANANALVTRIIPVKHVSATELVPILRPLMPQGGQLIAHAASNSLVVSDRASNVARLARIIERIDLASDAAVEVIPLQHANAAELARTLSLLADDKTAQANGQAARVFADTRTNSILLAGAGNARLRMRALVAHLDTPMENGGDTNVVYLNYASAKDLVPILQGVAATLTGEAPPTAAKAGDATAGAGGSSVATIQAHEETNSLIISAPPAIFRSLASVVRQLDIRRAQVLIEAVIAEVADSTAAEIGVQWFTAPQTGTDEIGQGLIGGTNFPGPNGTSGLIGLAQNPLGLGAGLSLGYVDGTIRIPGTDNEILNLGALVRALKGDGKTNILSTPSILTLDNHEAEIKVAQEVPFLTGQYTSTGTGGTSQPTNPFQTIERKDVGLVLKVTPHINEGDAVRLDIHQEVSSLAPPVTGAVDLVTNKRELSTSVLVADNALLVLGGLIDSNLTDNVSKVPLLGDIPLLGNLFRYRSNNNQKRDLMVFLHPKILRDAATEAAVSSEKYNYMRTEQLEMRQTPEMVTPPGERPLLPAVHDFLTSPSLDGAPSASAPAARASAPAGQPQGRLRP